MSEVTPLELQEFDVEKKILAVNMLNYSSVKERERSELLLEIDKDPELQVLKKVISNGWPDKRSNVASNLQPYWNYHDELTIECGILMTNCKILIPARRN